MKINCGKTAEQKKQERKEKELKKHKVIYKTFLWFPKRMEDNLCYWLEDIYYVGLYMEPFGWFFSFGLTREYLEKRIEGCE